MQNNFLESLPLHFTSRESICSSVVHWVLFNLFFIGVSSSEDWLMLFDIKHHLSELFWGNSKKELSKSILLASIIFYCRFLARFLLFCGHFITIWYIFIHVLGAIVNLRCVDRVQNGTSSKSNLVGTTLNCNHSSILSYNILILIHFKWMPVLDKGKYKFSIVDNVWDTQLLLWQSQCLWEIWA